MANLVKGDSMSRAAKPNTKFLFSSFASHEWMTTSWVREDVKMNQKLRYLDKCGAYLLA